MKLIKAVRETCYHPLWLEVCVWGGVASEVLLMHTKREGGWGATRFSHADGRKGFGVLFSAIRKREAKGAPSLGPYKGAGVGVNILTRSEGGGGRKKFQTRGFPIL